MNATSFKHAAINKGLAMACTTTSTNINLEAAYVTWGKEDQVCITPAIGLSGGEYFKLSSQNTKYVFYTTVNSVGADPAVAGYTSVEVAVATAYTVADWITAFITAAETTDEFLALGSTDGLSVKSLTLDVGAPLEVAVDVDTSFVLLTDVAGVGGDLGKSKDAIEVTTEVTTFDVTSNTTGENILDKIVTGSKASLSMSLLEMTVEKWELIVGDGYGDKLTPSGGTQVVGFGDGKVNSSAFSFSGKLILHPVRLASSDRTRDIVFHKCLPLPESINYDGTDSQSMSASFEAFVDESKDSKINIFAFGDWRQDLR